MRNTVTSTNFFAYDTCGKCGQLNRTDATWCSQCSTSLTALVAPSAAVRGWYARSTVALRVGAICSLLSLLGLSWWYFAR